jgi:eukaryotic-like serine/threonine-protein kinase
MNGPDSGERRSQAETVGGVSSRTVVGGPLPGEMVGPYRLLSVIGEGGFGVVYLAERREPMVQRVALKVLKPGMDSAAVVARFDQERQALAVMDHPNVARVFDGGVTERGLPYFVMEHVSGQPITVYCDRRRLTIRQRIELFIPVCEAVQHAHQKGIIHRDLKPGNVLVSEVDGHGVPKVIDFGVAKAITPVGLGSGANTLVGSLIGTPEYMSPEQVVGESDIDTRTDVYSLGVVLYELLTGELPFDAEALRRGGMGEVQRIIRELSPPKPSTRLASVGDARLTRTAENRAVTRERLSAELRRELDWIPLMAMRKERERRYASAAAMAEDLRRYLDGRTLRAAPESRAYLARKFVQRNRAGVGAGVAVAGALVVGLGAAVWQAREAAGQRDEARFQASRADERAAAAETAERDARTAQAAEAARAAELREVSAFQESMLRQIDATAAGRRLRDDLLARHGAALERGEGGSDPSASGFARELGRVNATDAAVEFIDRTILAPAVRALDEQFRDKPALDAQLRQALADRYVELGRFDAALPLQERALELRRTALGEDHADTLVSISSMAYLLDSLGRTTEALPYFREVLERARVVFGPDHENTIAAESNLGYLLFTLARSDEAEPYYRRALESSRRVLGPEHPSTVTCLANTGFLLRSMGRRDEAEAMYRQVLEVRRRVLGGDAPDTVTALNNLGSLLIDAGRAAEAEPLYREALETSRRVLGQEHPSTLNAVVNSGSLLVSLGRPREAVALLAPAEQGVRKVFVGENASRVAALLGTLGAARAGLAEDAAELAAAEKNLLEARSIYEAQRGATHRDTMRVGESLARLYERWDRLEPGKGYGAKVADWRAKGVGTGGGDGAGADSGAR